MFQSTRGQLYLYWSSISKMEQSFTSSMIPTLTASSPRLDLSRNLLTFSSLNSTLLFRIYGSHSISQVGKPSSLRLLSHSYSSTPSLNSQEVSETASLPCPERKASKKASHLRPHLLATLPRADLRPEVTREVVVIFYVLSFGSQYPYSDLFRKGKSISASQLS